MGKLQIRIICDMLALCFNKERNACVMTMHVSLETCCFLRRTLRADGNFLPLTFQEQENKVLLHSDGQGGLKSGNMFYRTAA